ncbi:hypothetical protein [Microbacterium sp.]|uniref:hypothetical protein n=1 Tax=Microbacterium sp. TaxID=51671 RepID=UPI002609FCC5|nr:hypothetical protein [Microbacterium sp.]
MFNIDSAGVWTSDNLWAWYAARQSVSEAISALEDAGVGLVPLIDASNWQADGVRALHEQLQTFKDRTAAESGQLSSRKWEIEAAAGA